MYAKAETDVSLRHLHPILDGIRTEYCLIGGWAVYYLVNERYRSELMRDYLGSRDIDIGVPDVVSLMTIDELLVKRMQFTPLSFRYVKYIHYDTGEELDAERARSIPLHMLIELFVDLMVPFSKEAAGQKAGLVPPDEPILARVFGDARNRTTVTIGGREVPVPVPETILAMKLNSVGNRNKDHKRVKDLCDIAALCLFTGKDLDDIIEGAKSGADPEKSRAIRSSVRDEDILQASGFLGLPPPTVRAIIERLSS